MKSLKIAPSLALALAFISLAGAAWAGPPTHTKVLGKTFGQWSAEWWQWVTSIPSATNPLVQTGVVDCSIGENGGVIFLAGTLGGTAVRTCSVPKKAIFFPLINIVNFNLPGFSSTVVEKRQVGDFVMSMACNLNTTIDGTPVIYEVARVRTQSAPFSLVAGPDDVLGRDPGAIDTETISDGIWIMLPPLSEGAHTLRFTGAVCSPPGTPTFEVDVTYNLTVLLTPSKVRLVCLARLHRLSVGNTPGPCSPAQDQGLPENSGCRSRRMFRRGSILLATAENPCSLPSFPGRQSLLVPSVSFFRCEPRDNGRQYADPNYSSRPKVATRPI